MLSGHRPPPRRRGNSRAKRIAVPFAIPMALGLTLGIMLAVSGGNNTHIDQSPLGTSARPSVSAPASPATSRRSRPRRPRPGRDRSVVDSRSAQWPGVSVPPPPAPTASAPSG